MQSSSHVFPILMRGVLDGNPLVQDSLIHVLQNKPPTDERKNLLLWNGILQNSSLDATQKTQLYGRLDFTDKIPDLYFECMDKFSYAPLQDLMRLDSGYSDVTLIHKEVDSQLQELLEVLRADICKMNPRQAYEHIATTIASRMSSLEKSQDVQSLKESLGSCVVPLGMITRGKSRHRAILFKFICDELSTAELPLPCTYVQTPVHDHSYNVVMLNNEQFVIDLLYEPGQFLGDDTKEAEQYRKTKTYVRVRDRPREYPYDVITEVKKDLFLGDGPLGSAYRVTIYSLYSDREEMVLKEIKLFDSSSKEQLTKKLNQLRYLKHDNIVEMKQGWVDGMYLRIFTEIMSTNAHSLIHDHTERMEYSREVLMMVLGLVRGSYYLSQKGLVHDNIKPKNVLLNIDRGAISSVKLCDFEIGRLIQSDDHETRIASYLSPESYWGVYNDASMVYGIGLFIGECITRREPSARWPIRDEEVAGKAVDMVLQQLAALRLSCCKKEPSDRIKLAKLLYSVENMLLEFGIDDLPPNPTIIEPPNTSLPILSVANRVDILQTLSQDNMVHSMNDTNSSVNLTVLVDSQPVSPVSPSKRGIFQKLKDTKDNSIKPKTDRFWAKHFSTKLCACTKCGYKGLKGTFYGELYDITYCPKCKRPVDLTVQ